jgi:hypothetical protein
MGRECGEECVVVVVGVGCCVGTALVPALQLPLPGDA